jgi:hypothetical protein
MCVIDEERQCGGDMSGDCTYQRVEAVSACSSDEDCDAGTCVVADRCAPEALPPGKAGCGCTSGWSAATGFMLLALLPWVTRKRDR